jgi:hypothetical protein
MTIHLTSSETVRRQTLLENRGYTVCVLPSPCNPYLYSQDMLELLWRRALPSDTVNNVLVEATVLVNDKQALRFS